MKFFLGVKNKDFLKIKSRLPDNIYFIRWPDDYKKKKSIIQNDFNSYKNEKKCYIHFSGYQKLSKIEMNIFDNRCINVHPAPPSYPGVGGINWAIYEGKLDFGITVHKMNNKIDDGKIIDFFPVQLNKETNIELASEILLVKRVKIIDHIIKEISSTSFSRYCRKKKVPKSHLSWGEKHYMRKDLNKMQNINLDHIKDVNEIKRLINAFHINAFPSKILFNEKVYVLEEVSNFKSET